MPDTIRTLRIMVTGATSGVGEALSRQLSQRGASVLVHGRDAARVREVTAGLLAAGGNAQAFVADLGSLSQIRQLANSVNAAGHLDVLVNNAGVGFGRDPRQRETSADGFELRFAVNSPRVLSSSAQRVAP